jgi:N-acetylglucosaminyldiphosphoundecaprenol N-acetyl-beta-D-mannosaminyltransferase
MVPTDESTCRIRLFGVQVDCVDMAQTLARVMHWIESPVVAPCRYVVTPNLDHVVMLQRDARLREAYEQAALVLADGWPLVVSSRLLGKPLPERVAGSDLVPALLEHSATRGSLRLFLLGAMPGVAHRAAEKIAQRWPHVEVVGVDSPPLGFERDPSENQQILDHIAQAQPELLVVGLGAPKQENWLRDHAAQLQARVAIGAGATIDFLAGQQRRAPRWMQALYLEWLYRVLSDPKRLAGRYLRDAAAFPGLFYREWRAAGGS